MQLYIDKEKPQQQKNALTLIYVKTNLTQFQDFTALI